MMDYMREFIKDRREAFIDCIENDSLDKVYAYMKKYGEYTPPDEKIMFAGIYKAAQEITDIPQEIKDKARAKCIALGFKPTMY